MQYDDDDDGNCCKHWYLLGAGGLLHIPARTTGMSRGDEPDPGYRRGDHMIWEGTMTPSVRTRRIWRSMW